MRFVFCNVRPSWTTVRAGEYQDDHMADRLAWIVACELEGQATYWLDDKLAVIWGFENPETAMLFKLTWAGQ